MTIHFLHHNHYIRARRAAARRQFGEKVLTLLAMLAVYGLSSVLMAWTIFFLTAKSVRLLVAVFL